MPDGKEACALRESTRVTVSTSSQALGMDMRLHAGGWREVLLVGRSCVSLGTDIADNPPRSVDLAIRPQDHEHHAVRLEAEARGPASGWDCWLWLR